MNVLALSTSTPRGSAAVVRDGEAPASVAYADLAGHAERIFTAIDAALAEAGLSPGAVDALACDVGPGSFTGVRVGVASAKGAAMGLDLPLVPVISLEAMAHAAFALGAAGPGDVVVAAIDAKKSELFVAAYDASGSALLPPCTRAVGPEAFVLPASAGRRVVVVGEIAGGVALPDGAILARGPALDMPDASWIGRLALARLAAGARPDPGDVEPLYVRPPDAVPAVPPRPEA